MVLTKLRGWKWHSIEYRISLAIPVDVATAGVVAGGNRFASRRTRWGNGGAVRHDVAVFVVSRMAVAEGDEAALIMPRGKACGVAVRGGEEKLIGIAQEIKWCFGGTGANVGKQHEGGRMGHHGHSEDGWSAQAHILVGERL